MTLSLVLEGLRKHRPGCSFNWSTVQHLPPMEKMTKRESGDQKMSANHNQRQERKRAASVF
jgi:hypothetical protein